ncbi:MAG: hypothetical protein J6X23_02275 [Bacteroidaceae bacterium]|jgi:hypothetical protein|nr:hypothetical protein [Bacteroidaceae bacterium]MBQ1634288.1 hypothetical protein [Bacteroidaceae bacterium]MBR4527862.1 hypothetical protein [Bacteroidaceae bacterium]
MSKKEEKKKLNPEEENILDLQQNKQQVKEDGNGQRLLNSLLNEGEDEDQPIKGWKDLTKVLSIDGQWFRRQIWVILIIVLGIIVYITNRYQAQSEIILEENLRDSLKDMKFRSLTRSSELTLKCRQSKLEEQLKANGDSNLAPSTEAPFYIYKNK